VWWRPPSSPRSGHALNDHAISYKLLERGTTVVTRDGEPVGTVAEVLENVREHIFDGIVVAIPGGNTRFVDAPEIARITQSMVTLTLNADEAAALPESDPKGAREFRANPSKRFGRLWKKR